MTEMWEDLGITICDDLKPNTHIKYITTKANQCIGLMKQCIESISEKIIKTLYETMIRPLLEYASPAWNPFYKKDVYELQKVQKRALKLSIAPIESVPLEQRQLEADLCEVYKYLSGLNRNNPEHFFYQCSSNLRGHSLRLRKMYSRIEIRKHFFTNCVVDHWNKLPEEVITASSLNPFKKKLRSLATKRLHNQVYGLARDHLAALAGKTTRCLQCFSVFCWMRFSLYLHFMRLDTHL